MESFKIYKNNYLLIKTLKKSEQEKISLAVFQYMFDDIEPRFSEDSSLYAIWINLQRVLNKIKTKSNNGSKGGAPKGNDNARKKQPKNNLKTTKIQPKKQANNSCCSLLNNTDNLEEDKGVIGGEEETFMDLYTLVEQSFAKTLSPVEYEEISTWEDNQVTRYAIKQAILNGASGIKYISTILESYKKKNITTLEQAKRDTEQFKNRKRKPKMEAPDWIDKEFEVKEASLEVQEEMQKKINEVIKREN